jgi:hypothetical protein
MPSGSPVPVYVHIFEAKPMKEYNCCRCDVSGENKKTFLDKGFNQKQRVLRSNVGLQITDRQNVVKVTENVLH